MRLIKEINRITVTGSPPVWWILKDIWKCLLTSLTMFDYFVETMMVAGRARKVQRSVMRP